MGEVNEKVVEKVKCVINKDVLVDATVEASFDHTYEVGYAYRCHPNEPEELVKALEKVIAEFEDFLRDHRSQDMICLSVNRITKDLCSECNEEWESDDYDGETHCAYCGAVLTNDN